MGDEDEAAIGEDLLLLAAFELSEHCLQPHSAPPQHPPPTPYLAALEPPGALLFPLPGSPPAWLRCAASALRLPCGLRRWGHGS